MPNAVLEIPLYFGKMFAQILHNCFFLSHYLQQKIPNKLQNETHMKIEILSCQVVRRRHFLHINEIKKSFIIRCISIVFWYSRYSSIPTLTPSWYSGKRRVFPRKDSGQIGHLSHYLVLFFCCFSTLRYIFVYQLAYFPS